MPKAGSMVGVQQVATNNDNSVAGLKYIRQLSCFHFVSFIPLLFLHWRIWPYELDIGMAYQPQSGHISSFCTDGHGGY